MVWSFLCPHPKCSNRHEIDSDEFNGYEIVTESCDGCGGQIRVKSNAPISAANSDEVAVQVRHEYDPDASDKIPFEQYGSLYKRQDLEY